MLYFIRLDIASAVNRLCQFMHKQTYVEWLAAKGIMRYRKDTMYHGVTLQKAMDFNLTDFSDSD